MIGVEPVDPWFEVLARDDMEYRKALIAEAAEVFLNGEINVARLLLRDIVRGAYGYDAVAAAADMPRHKVVRALQPSRATKTAVVRDLIEAVCRLAKVTLAVSVKSDEAEVAAHAAE